MNTQATANEPSKAEANAPGPGPFASQPQAPFWENEYTELVIGLVGAVGTPLGQISDVIQDRLKAYRYKCRIIRMSEKIIPLVVRVPESDNEFKRISNNMDAGNAARETAGDNSILALGAVAEIATARTTADDAPQPQPRMAYVIQSLKHPEEVARLRAIYPEGFFLVGVYSEKSRRHEYLTDTKGLTADEAVSLMQRDEDEHLQCGQQVSATFHLSDVFIHLDSNIDKLRNSIWRTLETLFGHPHVTPTFDEYAMNMAFSASLRSADLSRQVGAVIARNGEIVATGANDCPKFGGGLYVPVCDPTTGDIRDVPNGRDHMRGYDSNKLEQKKIIDDIVQRLGGTLDPARVTEVLQSSMIGDITEYGRTVHAEMEALLSCGRTGTVTKGGTLYCTTFPCHNCAKHIVAAGIERVVYVEPYPKSKASELHSDSIEFGLPGEQNKGGQSKVRFEPFVGIGPRRFFDLFSMRLGSGYPLQRKNSVGASVDTNRSEARPRIRMLPCSYLTLEQVASGMFERLKLEQE